MIAVVNPDEIYLAHDHAGYRAGRRIEVLHAAWIPELVFRRYLGGFIGGADVIYFAEIRATVSCLVRPGPTGPTGPTSFIDRIDYLEITSQARRLTANLQTLQWTLSELGQDPASEPD